MKKETCPEESAVSMAARSGDWQASLETHVAGCAICRDITQTSRWMKTLAESSEGNPALPDPGLLWWKAHLSQKRAEVRRTEEALEWAEIFSLAIVAIGLGWAVWNGQVFQRTADWLVAAVSPESWMASYSVAGATPIPFWSIVLALSLLAIFIAFPMLAEE